ncbi:MAG: hypothetical protein QM736_06120 [Vicinamibacterales bacterium]
MTTPRPHPHAIRRLCAAAVGLLGLMTLSATAQTVAPPSPDSAKPEPKKIALPRASETAKTTDEKTDTAEDDVVQLAPFVVAAEERSWLPSHLDARRHTPPHRAARRRRRDLRGQRPSSWPIPLRPTPKDVLVYTTGHRSRRHRGQLLWPLDRPRFLQRRGSALTSPNSMTRVRGLSGADLTRDFFSTEHPGLDSYNTERIDISRGANAILFGLGSPAGIINNQLKIRRTCGKTATRSANRRPFRFAPRSARCEPGHR